MESKWTYLIQGAGFILAAIGLVLTFQHPEITALLAFGGLAFFTGWFLRNRHIL